MPRCAGWSRQIESQVLGERLTGDQERDLLQRQDLAGLLRQFLEIEDGRRTQGDEDLMNFVVKTTDQLEDLGVLIGRKDDQGETISQARVS